MRTKAWATHSGGVKSGWARLWDGWQVGLVVIVSALLALWLALPRAVLPAEIPMPIVRSREVLTQEQLDTARAKQADALSLPFEVRALGEAIRLYGASDGQGQAQQASQTLDLIHRRTGAAVSAGNEAVLTLRAYQMKGFLEALRAYQRSGVESPELQELGGSWVAFARRTGWLCPHGTGFHLLPNETVLRILFHKRWNELTGLAQAPFALSLDEERTLSAFFFEHPPLTVPAQSPERTRVQAANQYRLRKVEELGRVDKDYPLQYARGVLLLRLEQDQDAYKALADFVQMHPDGPYALRARNALAEARRRLIESGNALGGWGPASPSR